MDNAITLVACVKTKLRYACAAQEIYSSPWFLHAKAYAERQAIPWYILSAHHGLLLPTQVIEPYELSLKTMPRSDRAAWAMRVLKQLQPVFPSPGSVYLLAGKAYWSELRPGLEEQQYTVETPLGQISGIGNQINWFKEH